MAVSKECPSSSGEMLPSRDGLQFLNEELIALNTQLKETLEQQRSTADDLQNILNSTDVATLFLDTDLKIRFFTRAIRSLFNVITGDIGRPLSDLSCMAVDNDLIRDCRAVLRGDKPVAREIQSHDKAWYIRKVRPYPRHDHTLAGVVITFTDITEQKHTTTALEEAKQEAETANIAKSRFLAAASHDLRQPLQTLALVQGLLAKAVEGENAQKLVTLLGQTAGAMSGMLNTILDINQIDAGTVRVQKVGFPVTDLFFRLTEEFSYHAQAHGLDFRVVPCSVRVRSDPHLLEQMVRNLLSNALKYTTEGKVLLGARRHGNRLSIEVWDTGIGIADEDLSRIFEEYHQVDNPARESSRGLGLGLSIVQRLGELLDHPVSVRSHSGKGSVFRVDVMRDTGPLALLEPDVSEPTPDDSEPTNDKNITTTRKTGKVLVIEDDPDIRDLVRLALEAEGHSVTVTPDGNRALDRVVEGRLRPDIILADYSLPGSLNGLEASQKLREQLRHQIPVIILTGDISTTTLRDTSMQDCLQLTKPVKVHQLAQAIQQLLPTPCPARTEIKSGARRETTGKTNFRKAQEPVVYVVDDDAHVRDALRDVLETDKRAVEVYPDCKAFLDHYRSGHEGCLLIDAYLPGMSGLELLRHLHQAGDPIPAIMITGGSDVSLAVQAMKAGAMDFIEKPFRDRELLQSVEHALNLARNATKFSAWQGAAADRLSTLTTRQRQIMELVLAGQPNKIIAANLGISQRTVENHRASIMKKTGAMSLPELARLAMTAERSGIAMKSQIYAHHGGMVFN